MITQFEPPLSPGYIGRFAPSPTGHLHFGSLIGALASYLDAKANQGLWLLRIEDLDPPREITGAAQAILDSLQAHGLQWDNKVLWQSQQHQHYQQAVNQLLQQQQAFYCQCSRSQLAANKGIHKGPCVAQSHDANHAIRLAVSPQTVSFNDPLQGPIQQQLASDVGDFVIQRKDKLFAYQLAVVLDDALQGITHVVRGSDLLDSTPRQIYLQQQLSLPTPHYLHFPVITHHDGQKLSKQNFAPIIDKRQARQNILKALFFLNQALPPCEQQNNCQDILTWAIEHWRVNTIPKQLTIDEKIMSDFAC